jgi:hypothetical protein
MTFYALLLRARYHHAADVSLPQLLDLKSQSSPSVQPGEGGSDDSHAISKHAGIVKLHQKTFSNNFVRALPHLTPSRDFSFFAPLVMCASFFV